MTLTCLAAASACTSTEAPEAYAEGAENAFTEGKVRSAWASSFTGEFGIPADSNLKVEFSVTHINWDLGTARWTARIVTREGAPVSVLSEAEPMSMTWVPSGFTFKTKAVDIAFKNDTFEGMTHADFRVIAPKITSSKEDETDPTGACSITCNSNTLVCKHALTKTECLAAVDTTPMPECSPGLRRAAKFSADASCRGDIGR